MRSGEAASIHDILEELELGSLASRFEAEEITPSILPHLDDVTLRNLGVVTVGARCEGRGEDVQGRGHIYVQLHIFLP